MLKQLNWFNTAREKHYRTVNDWLEAVNEAGWELEYKRAKNWVTTNSLPNSLTAENYRVIAETLHLPVDEVLRREGHELDLVIDDLTVPSQIAHYVRQLCELPRNKLNKISPLMNAQFDELVKLIDNLPE